MSRCETNVTSNNNKCSKIGLNGPVDKLNNKLNNSLTQTTNNKVVMPLNTP